MPGRRLSPASCIHSMGNENGSAQRLLKRKTRIRSACLLGKTASCLHPSVPDLHFWLLRPLYSGSSTECCCSAAVETRCWLEAGTDTPAHIGPWPFDSHEDLYFQLHRQASRLTHAGREIPCRCPWRTGKSRFQSARRRIALQERIQNLCRAFFDVFLAIGVA